jgi:hypothetical protein
MLQFQYKFYYFLFKQKDTIIKIFFIINDQIKTKTIRKNNYFNKDCFNDLP